MRKSIRLKEFDYSTGGAYFITICTHKYLCLFGHISVGAQGIAPLSKDKGENSVTRNINAENNMPKLNKYGAIVYEEWFKSAQIRQEIELVRDEFVVMPNHIHGIIWIREIENENNNKQLTPNPMWADGRPPLRRRPHSLSSFVAGFKSAVTTRINQIRNTPGIPVWQRNYYEHIIRDEKDFFRVKQYILDNPYKCECDQYYTQ